VPRVPRYLMAPFSTRQISTQLTLLLDLVSIQKTTLKLKHYTPPPPPLIGHRSSRECHLVAEATPHPTSIPAVPATTTPCCGLDLGCYYKPTKNSKICVIPAAPFPFSPCGPCPMPISPGSGPAGAFIIDLDLTAEASS